MPAQPFIDEEESIYKLLPLPSPAPNKAPLYHSKHPHSTPPTASTFGASTATANVVTNAGGEYESPARVHQHVKEYGIFGPKRLHQPNPLGFVPAHTHAALPIPNKYTYTDRRKEPLNVRFNNNNNNTQSVASSSSVSSSSPSTSNTTASSSLSSSTRSKNFIKDNVARLSSPEVKRSSSNRLNKNNTLLNNYRNKPDYGQKPAYLSSVKQQVAAEQKLIADTLAAQLSANSTPVQLLAEPDRIALLGQLKIRWEEVMQQYQVLTHQTTNTLSIGNQKRKEELEKKLAEIEKSITKMEKPFVVIQQNN